jgi:flagellin-like hook-associated protein FlgL
LDISGQEFMFVAGQDGPNDARLHKINLSTGARQEFTQVSGGAEKLRGLSENNGKLYMAYSRVAGFFGSTRGEIVRVNSDMTRDNGWGNSSGRVMNTNAHNDWDFGIDEESRVDMAFDGGNLYVQMDNRVKSRIKSFDVATGTVSADNDFDGFISSGVGGGTQVHSPVIDGGNIYAAVDSTTGGQNQIVARQLNGSAIAGWTDINLPGTEKVIQNPVINGAHLYVSTDKGNVYKYLKATPPGPSSGGTQVGNFASGFASSLTMPVFDGTDFYVGQTNGRVHKVDSATMTRNAAWPAPGVLAAGAIEAGPLVVGTEVYIGSPSRVQAFGVPAAGTTISDQNVNDPLDVPTPHDYTTTHSAGDNIAVTVETTAGILTKWEGTAEVMANGSLDLKNFAVNPVSGGTITDLTGNANVTVVTPAVAPILPASVSFGTNYTALENPTVTVTKPDLTTQNLPAADITNNGDGTLTVSLANVVLAGTGNYDLTASAGSRYLQATTFNDQGAVGAYPATETPQLLSVTDAGGFTVTGISTTSAVADANGQLDVVLAGTPSATGTLTLTFEGAMTATPGGPFANVGTNYAPGEVVLVTTNIPTQGGGGPMTATATNNNDGTLTISALNGIPSSGSSTAANAYNVTADAGIVPTTGSPSLAQTSLSNVGSGYNPGEPVPTIIVTVTDPNNNAVTGAIVTGINVDGTLNVDLTGVSLTAASPTGTYTIATSNGTIASIPTALNGIGSGYAQAEPAPVVTVTDPVSATLAGATASINANGTIDVNLAGITPTTAGSYTVNVAGGTVSGVQQGLDDTGKDLWDFSHADFNNFIQTLTDVRAVNGATTNSLAFSESRLETNIQNLELAGGRIVDADMAAEMVEVAKSQILLRAATDSLTKHNRLSVDVDRTLMGLSGGM